MAGLCFHPAAAVTFLVLETRGRPHNKNMTALSKLEISRDFLTRYLERVVRDGSRPGVNHRACVRDSECVAHDSDYVVHDSDYVTLPTCLLCASATRNRSGSMVRVSACSSGHTFIFMNATAVAAYKLRHEEMCQNTRHRRDMLKNTKYGCTHNSVPHFSKTCHTT